MPRANGPTSTHVPATNGAHLDLFGFGLGLPALTDDTTPRTPLPRLRADFDRALDALEAAIAARDFARATTATSRVHTILPEVQQRAQVPARAAAEQAELATLQASLARFRTIAPKAPMGHGPAAVIQWYAVIGAPAGATAQPANGDDTAGLPFAGHGEGFTMPGAAEPGFEGHIGGPTMPDDSDFTVDYSDVVHIVEGPVAWGLIEMERATNPNPVVRDIADELHELAENPAYAAGFGLGMLHGGRRALVDFVRGPIDLAHDVIDLIYTQVTRGDVAVVRRLVAKLTALVEAAPKALDWFRAKWNAADDYPRGDFRGTVCGYGLTTLALAVAAAYADPLAAISGELAVVFRAIELLDTLGDITALLRPLGVLKKAHALGHLHAPDVPHVPHTPDAPHVPHAHVGGDQPLVDVIRAGLDEHPRTPAAHDGHARPHPDGEPAPTAVDADAHDDVHVAADVASDPDAPPAVVDAVATDPAPAAPDVAGPDAPIGPTAAAPAAAPGRKMTRARKKRLRQAARRLAAAQDAGVTLLGVDDALRWGAKRITPEPGFIDVVVHGEVDNFIVIRLDGAVRLNQRSFATYLRKRGLDGMAIRLIACDSGRHPRGIAQQLANQLDVTVRAPTDLVWVKTTGEMGVGKQPGQNSGRWETFEPRAVKPRVEKFDALAAERRGTAESDRALDVDAPQAVFAPRTDLRERVNPTALAELSTQMGARVVIDPSMHNGVSVAVERRAALIGFDLHVTEVRVGVDATISDVLAHASTVANVERYNGVLGKLRELWHRAVGKHPDSNPYRRGSRAWATHEELAKLDRLLASRRAITDGTVDAATLADEIAFLEGRRSYHEETLRTIDEMGAGDGFSVDGPDIGAVTREAEGRGYRLPGRDEGVESGWYYYRNKPGRPGEYSLAINPYKAPADAPSLQVTVVNGKFAGFETGGRAPAVEIPHDMAPADVVTHLRSTEGFGPYAAMLERHGLASSVAIDAAVSHARGKRLSAGERVTTDALRHEVKEYFRERVVAKLTDPTLKPEASYRQMREMLDGLAPADRGNLAEVWYRQRYAPDAQPHVGVQVPRSSGANANKVESRVIDAVDGGTAIEIKDIEGKVDQEQFDAYLDMLRVQEEGGQLGIRKLKYVFTKPEGAVANLEQLAAAMDRQALSGRVSVEAFDHNGQRHVVRTAVEARALLKLLNGGK